MDLSDIFSKAKNAFNNSAASGSKLKDMLGETENQKAGSCGKEEAESQEGNPMPSNPRTSQPAASDFWGPRFVVMCLGNKKYRFCILGALLILLLILPIKLGPFHDGKGPNAKFPVMGQIEALCAHENNRLLAQSAKAYLATKLITKSIAIVKDMQLSLGPMNFTPGSFLAGSLDAIDRVANGLFVVMTVMGVEKCLLGIISWLCFKILFPIAIILRIIYDWKPYIMARVMAVFIFRLCMH